MVYFGVQRPFDMGYLAFQVAHASKEVEVLSRGPVLEAQQTMQTSGCCKPWLLEAGRRILVFVWSLGPYIGAWVRTITLKII